MVDFIYSTDKSLNQVPVRFTKRANAPERGCVFTSRAERVRDKKDLVLRCFSNYTGYVKEGERDLSVNPSEFYRFKIVAGPYTKRNHNFFYAIPLRETSDSEGGGLNLIDASTYIYLQRLGEFLMGYGWNRKKKKHYLLKDENLNWEWFFGNFGYLGNK